MANLTTAQKIHICSTARQAYEAWGGREEHERTVGTGKNGLTAWRHDHQETAIGVRSLRHCSDADYKPLLSHFHRLRMGYMQAAATRELTFSQ